MHTPLFPGSIEDSENRFVSLQETCCSNITNQEKDCVYEGSSSAWIYVTSKDEVQNRVKALLVYLKLREKSNPSKEGELIGQSQDTLQNARRK